MERPILFSSPMVIALLDGTKTQTRRIIKPQPTKEPWFDKGIQQWRSGASNFKCPHGKIGDRLWVRESCGNTGFAIVYKADYPFPDRMKWKPSIHMFRDDSRILLEITDIRIERLQDISDHDVFAEGCPPNVDAEPRDIYMTLWEKINGSGSWAKNPWVWCISFRRIK